MRADVSFVIPARNEEPSAVAATVAGIVATTDCRREIIVVDDASAEPVDVRAADLTVIRNREPVGVSRARRMGTEAATGRYLVWLDAHMTFAPGWLELMLGEADSGALLCAPWRDYDRRRVHAWGSDFHWCEERAYDRGLRPGFDFAHRGRPPRACAGEVPMIVGACYLMRRTRTSGSAVSARCSARMAATKRISPPARGCPAAACGAFGAP